MPSSLLARYGLDADSLVCLDSKPEQVERGHADSLQTRPLEVLKPLGFVGTILDAVCHLGEFAFWEPPKKGKSNDHTSRRQTSREDAHYLHMLTIGQAIIEQIIETGLYQYSTRGVHRGTKLVGASLDSNGDPEFLMPLDVDYDGACKTVRTQYLIAADGAHSTFRRSFSLSVEGASQNERRGVADLVLDTRHPNAYMCTRVGCHISIVR